MKKIKMIMVATLTILSMSLFAQVSGKNRIKPAMQTMGGMTYTCPMHGMVMTNVNMCQGSASNLSLTPKEKMKREAMKIDVSSKNQPAFNMACNSSNSLVGMNLSPKEQMKRDMIKIPSFVPPATGVRPMNMGLVMLNVVASNKPMVCSCCGSMLNLSLKEKMKREAVKI